MIRITFCLFNTHIHKHTLAQVKKGNKKYIDRSVSDYNLRILK